MARPKLTLYLDTVSPFAYMAFWVTRHSPVFKGCDTTYVPIFLGGVMKACGNTPPIKIKNKDKWIDIERLRWASSFRIPMAATVPDGFPPLTLSCQRALCALLLAVPEAQAQEKLTAAFDALYHAFWVERRPIQTPEVLGEVLAKVLGEEVGGRVMQNANGAEAKALLAKHTDKAMEDGAFGLPWFVATNAAGKTEAFWGFDHLGQVIDHLGLQRPAGRDEAGFRALL
ncbi:hypothetical protein B0A49_02821 [Cryomyces minteri]|uniref:Glutathione S-transferase kappa n=1 Tax=Cryomyces minteri TaxID=331657 RepID=A0A4U0XF89_9PEZI|nr:hypothetical protein B0A49_02821 [Cryomyces minteri]